MPEAEPLTTQLFGDPQPSEYVGYQIKTSFNFQTCNASIYVQNVAQFSEEKKQSGPHKLRKLWKYIHKLWSYVPTLVICANFGNVY